MLCRAERQQAAAQGKLQKPCTAQPPERLSDTGNKSRTSTTVVAVLLLSHGHATAGRSLVMGTTTHTYQSSTQREGGRGVALQLQACYARTAATRNGKRAQF